MKVTGVGSLLQFGKRILLLIDKILVYHQVGFREIWDRFSDDWVGFSSPAGAREEPLGAER